MAFAFLNLDIEIYWEFQKATEISFQRNNRSLHYIMAKHRIATNINNLSLKR